MSTVSQCVSVSWLKDNINNPDIKIVDGTWHKPVWKRNSQAEYLNQHIQGAVKFDVDQIADLSAPLPQTVPPLAIFEDHMGKLGIKDTDHVIIYDNNSNFGMYSAPRVWYMFKLYGHEKVSVLDGGLPKWLSERGAVVSGEPSDIKVVTYKGTYHDELHKTFEQMIDVQKNTPNLILDARSVGRFQGHEPEPDPEIPSGHIKGTRNLFWRSFIDSERKVFKNIDQIAKVFTDAGVNLDDSNVASCGSGMTACSIAFAASLCNKTIPVYTGSWIEWYKKGPEDTKVIGVKGEDINK